MTMSPYAALPAFIGTTNLVNVVVDTPKASRTKYKFDEETGLFRVSKLLPLGAYFPYNFGFIPSTRGEDGDALDVLILGQEPFELGTVAPIHILGVLTALQTEIDGQQVRNDRFLGVISTRYNPVEIVDLPQVHPHHLSEIEHFFKSYNQMEGRPFVPLERLDAPTALSLIRSFQVD